MMLKCIVIFLMCCAAVQSQPHEKRWYDLEKADQLFEEFVKSHQKQYKNEQDRQKRFNIFKDNLEKINELNMESETAVFGINKFTDLTLEELQQSYMGYKRTSHGDNDCIALVTPYVPPPKSFDWRHHNAVTKVKDQKNCGSCWAFSTIGNLEGQHAKKYKKLKEFSEQQLVDCDQHDHGCGGGMMTRAFLWLRDHGGIEAEDDYPYNATEGTCSFSPKKAQAEVRECLVPDLNNTSSNNETMLSLYLTEIGPLAIAVDAQMFMSYEGGILDKCKNDFLNHGVLLVGYGEEKGKEFWIIKNSWGEDYGENGYIRVAKNKNCCMLTDDVSTAELK